MPGLVKRNSIFGGFGQIHTYHATVAQWHVTSALNTSPVYFCVCSDYYTVCTWKSICALGKIVTTHFVHLENLKCALCALGKTPTAHFVHLEKPQLHMCTWKKPRYINSPHTFSEISNNTTRIAQLKAKTTCFPQKFSSGGTYYTF